MSHQEPFEAQTVVCPQCGGPSRYAVDNPWRPFCCERCKKIDMGAWAAEDYRMGNTPSEASEDELPPAALH